MKGLDAGNPKIIVKSVSGMVSFEIFAFKALSIDEIWKLVPKNAFMKINLSSYPSNERSRREKSKYRNLNYFRYGHYRENYVQSISGMVKLDENCMWKLWTKSVWTYNLKLHFLIPNIIISFRMHLNSKSQS